MHSPFLYALCEEVFWPLRNDRKAQQLAVLQWLHTHGAEDIAVFHSPRRNSRAWREWKAQHDRPGFITIDCFTYALAFRRAHMPHHHLALRPRILRGRISRAFVGRRRPQS